MYYQVGLGVWDHVVLAHTWQCNVFQALRSASLGNTNSKDSYKSTAHHGYCHSFSHLFDMTCDADGSTNSCNVSA